MSVEKVVEYMTKETRERLLYFFCILVIFTDMRSEEMTKEVNVYRRGKDFTLKHSQIKSLGERQEKKQS